VARALDFIRDPGGDRFEDVALEVFAHQFMLCEPYRRLCARRGVSPADVGSWERMPLVPTAAFRDVVLSTARPAHVFLTSGTTGRRGAHHLPELALYEAAWVEPFRAHVLPDRPSLRILSLVPPPAARPESSLSFMVSRIVDRFGTADSGWFLSQDGLDDEAFHAALASSERMGEPVLVAGTSLAFADVFDRWPAAVPGYSLPVGSRVLDTGGMKGRRREATRAELLEAYRRRWGIEASHVVGEYGMTELSSQFYEDALASRWRGPGGGAGGERLYRGCPWTRTLAVDPETLRPLPAGETGLLAHWDLANAWTISALVTGDLGAVFPEGFQLHGRAPGAEPRGCSLAAEDMLGG
jgi:hypothetical protein